MTDPQNGPNTDPGRKEMLEAVHTRRKRHDEGKRHGEQPLWATLSMIGAFGWLIVVPTLLGAFFGRWLDRTFETGIQFSGALIFIGLCLGAYLVWQRIYKA